MPTSETMETYALRKIEALFHKFESIIRKDVFFKFKNYIKKRAKMCAMEIGIAVLRPGVI